MRCPCNVCRTTGDIANPYGPHPVTAGGVRRIGCRNCGHQASHDSRECADECATCTDSLPEPTEEPA